MSGNDNSSVPTFQLFAEKRLFLLEVLQNQLDELLASRLIPQKDGVPFINFQEDPPQAVAIKKVINSLYYIEKALESIKDVNDNVWGYVKGAPALFKALHQVYKAISFLDDATPEVRTVIIQNYYILEPLYSKTHELIEQSGWVTEFSKLEATEKASKVIAEGISLLGSDVDKWDNTNPLIATFDKISKLMQSMATLQDNDLTDKEKKERMETIRSILDDLDKNAFISQLSITDFEEAKAVQDLLIWFKNIQDDGFNFTKNSIESYIFWANTYLPKIVLLADQLERQNYLKAGLLSQELCSNANKLAQEINNLLDTDTTFQIAQKVITTESLVQQREEHIDNAQIENIQTIMSLEEQQRAAASFYKIMSTYKNQSFSEITEFDRLLLRQIYPKIQMTLAHADLNLENALTDVLNTTGPEKIENKSSSFWGKVVSSVGYVVSFAKNYEVNKLLATEQFFDKDIRRKMDSEKLKMMISEKSKRNLQITMDVQVPPLEQTSLEIRVTSKIDEMKENLKKLPSEPVKVPEQFVKVKAHDLTNLRGTLTYIQNQKLSLKVRETRNALAILVKRHIVKEQDNSLHIPNVLIDQNSKVHEQIKEVEDNLLALEKELAHFETLDFSLGLTIHVQVYISVAKAAKKVINSVLMLAPESQKVLAPILSQLTNLGSSLANQDYTHIDLSSLESLQDTTVPPQIKQDIEKNDNQEEQKSINKTDIDYTEEFSKTRTLLLEQCRSYLTLPLTISLQPQEKGVPFVDLDKDPPQTAAIKKMINSLYYAETAIKTWQEIDTSTTFGKVAAAHQGIAALSQLYKSLQFFADASPELQNLIMENKDLIKPLLNSVKALISQSQLSGMEITNNIGSVLGQIISSVQPPREEQTQTASLVHLLSELPSLMNNMAGLVGGEEDISVSQLKLSQNKIDAISKVLELLFEQKSSFINIFKGPQAIIGLIELNKKFQKEATNLKESTISYFQQWLIDSYPNLLVMLDEVETQCYLKPGTLSDPIILEIDKIYDKLNEVYESKSPSSKLEKMPLSSDLASVRKLNLDIKKTDLWNEIFEYGEQQRAAHVFFDTLARYKDKKFQEISSEDRVTLRKSFALIQLALANTNVDLANECVILLNQLETVTPEQWVGVKITIPQILKQETSLLDYIAQKDKAVRLKIKVNEYAMEHVKLTVEEDFIFDAEELSVDALQKKYLEGQSNRVIAGPGQLKPVTSSSLSNIRGNLAFIQELEISSLTADMRRYCVQLTKDKFSNHIQNYLAKPQDQPLYTIEETDPSIVRQIKGIENSLYHLETAFKHFETISKSDKLVVQARALIEIQNEANHLKDALAKLTPELKEHYGPLASKMLEFSQKITSIDYNKEDLQDLVSVLQSAKEELLRRKKPGRNHTKKAFFDSHHSSPRLNSGESATTKAVKLGIKYLHLVSPNVEEARKYLRSRYPNTFDNQPAVVRNYTRQQLSDERLMRSEINRLQGAFQKHYGFNVTTAGVIINVIRQIQRVGAQTSEALGMVNQLVTHDYIKIKENAYKDLIIRLSKEEDYLCLKPGTLINPAMLAINQLFLSVALELNMSFENKVSILDDKKFLNILITDNTQEIIDLEEAQIKEPHNQEIAFKIGIKKEKLQFLNQQLNLVPDKDLRQTKGSLLDIQFEVYLRDLLKGTTIKKPIINEFEKIIREHYQDNKKEFLDAEDSALALYESIKNFERENISDYLIVYETYRMLRMFSAKIPSRHKDLIEYIESINKKLLDDTLSIKDRSLKVQSLPRDPLFLQKLSEADDGTHLIIKIIQFIQRVAASIIESIVTGNNIITIYKRKEIEDLKNNIENTLQPGGSELIGNNLGISAEGNKVAPESKLPSKVSQIGEKQPEFEEESDENQSMQLK